MDQRPLPVAKPQPSLREPQPQPSRVRDQLCRGVEHHKAQPPGPGLAQLRRQSQTIHPAQHVVAQHRQAEPSGIGVDATTDQHPAGQFVFQHMVHGFHRATLLAAPAQQATKSQSHRLVAAPKYFTAVPSANSSCCFLATRMAMYFSGVRYWSCGVFLGKVVELGARFHRFAALAAKLPLVLGSGPGFLQQGRVHGDADGKPNATPRSAEPLLTRSQLTSDCSQQAESPRNRYSPTVSGGAAKARCASGKGSLFAGTLLSRNSSAAAKSISAHTASMG